MEHIEDNVLAKALHSFATLCEWLPGEDSKFHAKLGNISSRHTTILLETIRNKLQWLWCVSDTIQLVLVVLIANKHFLFSSFFLVITNMFFHNLDSIAGVIRQKVHNNDRFLKQIQW